MILHFFKPQFN